MFQFLIGTLKTISLLVGFSNPHQVSIPYRHAKNIKLSNLILLNLLKFQFLIGTLKTSKSYNKYIYFYLWVSIPYRHAKNFKNTVRKLCKNLLVSIPYRHAKNKLIIKDGKYYISQFQFLIGTLKTNLFTSIFN